MAFKLFGKKKYPFNKQKKEPAAGVYAGPEYFARRSGRIYAGPEPSRGEREEILDVYAGPEFDPEPAPPEEIAKAFAEDDPLPPEDGEIYDTVYAGPEPPEETGPEEREDRTGQAVLIYAGPEFFAGRRPKTPKEEEKGEGEA